MLRPWYATRIAAFAFITCGALFSASLPAFSSTIQSVHISQGPGALSVSIDSHAFAVPKEAASAAWSLADAPIVASVRANGKQDRIWAKPFFDGKVGSVRVVYFESKLQEDGNVGYLTTRYTARPILIDRVAPHEYSITFTGRRVGVRAIVIRFHMSLVHKLVTIAFEHPENPKLDISFR
jgi:hypothetical protein